MEPSGEIVMAFPSSAVFDKDGNMCVLDGMTLLDYFAAKAMQSMVAGDGALMVAARDERYDETNWAEIVASNAYNFADAMLKERERRASVVSQEGGEA